MYLAFYGTKIVPRQFSSLPAQCCNSKRTLIDAQPTCHLTFVRATLARGSASLLTPSIDSWERWRWPETLHASYCSAHIAVMSLNVAASLGKMPTTLVRHLISTFNCSSELVDQIFFR